MLVLYFNILIYYKYFKYTKMDKALIGYFRSVALKNMPKGTTSNQMDDLGRFESLFNSLGIYLMNI